MTWEALAVGAHMHTLAFGFFSLYRRIAPLMVVVFPVPGFPGIRITLFLFMDENRRLCVSR